MPRQGRVTHSGLDVMLLDEHVGSVLGLCWLCLCLWDTEVLLDPDKAAWRFICDCRHKTSCQGNTEHRQTDAAVPRKAFSSQLQARCRLLLGRTDTELCPHQETQRLSHCKKQVLFFLCYSKEVRASLRVFPTSTTGQWHCQLLKQSRGGQHKLCKVLKGSAQCRNHRSLPAGPAKHCRAISPSGQSSHRHITPNKNPHTHTCFFHSEVQQMNCRQDRDTQL